MNCSEAQQFLDGYFDGELDLVRAVEIEEHLRQCPLCSAKIEGDQTLRRAITSPDLYFHSSANFKRSLKKALRRETAPTSGWSAKSRLRWLWVGAAAGLILIFSVVWSHFSSLRHPPETNELAQEIIDSHIRSLMPGHLTDVLSTDQHTVKPWFNGKLDFSPPVKNLEADGFVLVGGRLDYISGRNVAVLVYRYRLHIINLFLWPTSENPTSQEVWISRNGYHLAHWIENNLGSWAVSDLNEEELRKFTRLFGAPH